MNNLFSKLKDLVSVKDEEKREDGVTPVVRADQVEQQQQKIRDQERQRVERQYQEEHPDQIEEEKIQSFEYKTNKLKKKLNIAIITIFGLIIIVFLILFFV